MKTLDTDKLWKEYEKKPSQEIREQLIIAYSQLVKLVAGRLSMYLGHNVEYEDLVSYGIFGLIDAIDKFDMAKNVKFMTTKEKLSRFRNLTKGLLIRQKDSIQNNILFNLPEDCKSLSDDELKLIQQIKSSYNDLLASWSYRTDKLLNQVDNNL